MKALTLLCGLFLLGCEKRAVDPGVEAAKEWLLSEQGQNVVASSLSEEGQNQAVARGLLDDDLRVTLDQLVPCENWEVKRAVRPGLGKGESFALYAEEKIGDSGRLLFILLDEGRFGFYSIGHFVTESEFEDFGDPVSMEKVYDLNRSWRAKEFSRKAREEFREWLVSDEGLKAVLGTKTPTDFSPPENWPIKRVPDIVQLGAKESVPAFTGFAEAKAGEKGYLFVFMNDGFYRHALHTRPFTREEFDQIADPVPLNKLIVNPAGILEFDYEDDWYPSTER